MTSWLSIDTQPHQRYRKRASTDTAYYKSINTEVNRAQEGDYSIGSWADEHHHESIALETETYALGADKLQDSFTDEELLNMQRRDGTDQIRAEATWERTRTLMATLHVSREDIAYILQTANGADNLFMHQRSNLEQKATKEFYDTADSQNSAEELLIPTVPGDSTRKKRISMASFTQTKLVSEIYTKDEINEMFYGVCGEHEKNKEAFQMKLDGVYYPLNNSISWLTTCMEEIKQDIARIQHATDVARPPSIDRHHRTSIDNHKPTSIDDSPPRPNTMKSYKDFHTREEIDQLVEMIYRALETTEERLDG
ncbi:hypothetical protein DY000_02014344 [Brassica cretica]|uniref:Uncharacterized protein n=1 Tax=Brassica cretica TaxID=69181 RepID=A0ABQ7DD59_BRACR|nr:hypothetical protein DY000_02014344 [Brassica cretica]